MEPPSCVSAYSGTIIYMLYGLKQSRGAWSGRFNKSIKNFGNK
jgi:hypothetical protein